MNLLEAVTCAIDENVRVKGDCFSYAAYNAFTAMTKNQQSKINEFIELLLGYSFSDLLDWCGGSIPEPITRSINIVWMLEDVKEVRTDLTDQQASKVLEIMLFEFDPLVGLDLDTVKLTCDKL